MDAGGGRLEVAGADGCKDGWLVVRVAVSDRLHLLEHSIAPTFEELIQRTKHCAAVAVDIPIGLTDGPDRQADKDARRVLGQPRGSSVFRAPCWPVLSATTDDTEYEDVCEVSRSFCVTKTGKPAAMSQQAWRIMPKVRDANSIMTPPFQKKIIEVHPEVSFWALNGSPMPDKKSSSVGKGQRADALTKAFAGDLASLRLPPGAAQDDLYDACAAAWTASRLARDVARRLPPDPPVDTRGLRMEIVY